MAHGWKGLRQNKHKGRYGVKHQPALSQLYEPHTHFGNGRNMVLVGEELGRKWLRAKFKKHFVPENQLKLDI